MIIRRSDFLEVKEGVICSYIHNSINKLIKRIALINFNTYPIELFKDILIILIYHYLVRFIKKTY